VVTFKEFSPRKATSPAEEWTEAARGGKGETAAGTNYASLAFPGADLALHEAASKYTDGRHEFLSRENT
jgi:hypothetical protein